MTSKTYFFFVLGQTISGRRKYRLEHLSSEHLRGRTMVPRWPNALFRNAIRLDSDFLKQ